METPNRKLLETIARTVFPERFKVDPQGTLVLAFKWGWEYVQEFQRDPRLHGENALQVTCRAQQSAS